MSFIIYLLSGLYVCHNLFWCLLVGDHSFLWMLVKSFSIWNTMFTFDMQLSSVQRIMLWRVLLVISRWRGLLTRTREDYSLKTKVKVLVCVLEIDRFVLKGVFVVIMSLIRNMRINRLCLKTCDMWLVRETKLSLLIEVQRGREVPPTWVPHCTNALERFFDFSWLSSFIQSLTLWFLHVRSLTRHSHSFVHVLKDVKFESENREYSANTQNSKQLLALAYFSFGCGDYCPVTLLCSSAITILNPTLVWIFFTLYCIHFPMSWLGAFVWQSRAALVAGHFLYSWDHNVWFRVDIVRRN